MSEIDKIKRGLDVQAMMGHPGWGWVLKHINAKIDLQKDYLVSDTCRVSGDSDKVRGSVQELQQLLALTASWIRDGLREHEKEAQRGRES